jgi:hypothetical protein
MQAEVFTDTDDAENSQTDWLLFFCEVKWTKS